MSRQQRISFCLLVMYVTFTLISGCSGGTSSSSDGGSDGGSESDQNASSMPDEGASDTGSSPTETDSDSERAIPDTATSAQMQPENQAGIAAANFSPDVTDFSIDVIYEQGAEPYTGTLNLSISDTWEVTRRSFTDLFQHHAGRSITVPSVLEEMTQIEDNGVTNWTVAELVELGRAVAPALVDGAQVRPAIIFVSGMLGTRDNVLGVHISNTHFAFVFKDIVRDQGGNDTSQKYIEQATVIHEIGHAIGLVNNGVPLASTHEDTERPHHTMNSDGVMYFAVESGNGALEFATNLILGSRTSLFGPESLLDAQSYMPQ